MLSEKETRKLVGRAVNRAFKTRQLTRLAWERRINNWSLAIASVTYTVVNLTTGWKPGNSWATWEQWVIGGGIGAAMGALMLLWGRSIDRRLKKHPLHLLSLVSDIGKDA